MLFDRTGCWFSLFCLSVNVSESEKIIGCVRNDIFNPSALTKEIHEHHLFVLNTFDAEETYFISDPSFVYSVREYARKKSVFEVGVARNFRVHHRSCGDVLVQIFVFAFVFGSTLGVYSVIEVDVQFVCGLESALNEFSEHWVRE